jgi:hypothetical protein
VAVQRGVDHLRPVHQQPHRLPDPDIVEGCLVDSHGERDDAAGLGDDDLDAAGGVQGGDLGRVEGPGGVDLAGAQRVGQGDGVGEVGDGQRVGVGQAVLPVVRVAGEDALLAGAEGAVLERAGAVGPGMGGVPGGGG